MHPRHNNEMYLNFQNPSQEDGGNYIVRAVNEVGDKDCTLALNFGELNLHCVTGRFYVIHLIQFLTYLNEF